MKVKQFLIETKDGGIHVTDSNVVVEAKTMIEAIEIFSETKGSRAKALGEIKSCREVYNFVLKRG